MRTRRCPRCGKTIPDWQPVHLPCLIVRGRNIIISFLVIILLFFFCMISIALGRSILFRDKSQSNLLETTLDYQLSSTNTRSSITPSETPTPSRTTKPEMTLTPSSSKSTSTVRPTRTPTKVAIITSTPFKKITSTPLHTLTPTFDWGSCHAVYTSRLKVGDKAYVSYDPPLANNVREEPHKDSKLLGKIKPGEEVTIIKGPSCSNGWIWWKITAKKDGLTGWTAEGDADGYWLVPMK